MIALYPAPTPGYTVNGNNFQSEPVRSLYETKFDIRVETSPARIRCSPASATTRRIRRCPEARRDSLRWPMATAATRGIINHGRNVALGETHVFATAGVNQFSFGYNCIFNYITSRGTGTCKAAKIGIPGANIGCVIGTTCASSCCGLTSTNITGGGYWSLGDRGYSPSRAGQTSSP